MLKIFRKVSVGAHPEAEMSRYLTANGFAHAPALLGEVVNVARDERSSLAVAQAFVRNQGDAWAWTLDQFNRALDDLSTPADGSETRADKLEDYVAVAGAIGKRLAEMHAVLAKPTEDPAFAPEAATARDVEAWVGRATSLLDCAFASVK
jgi:maltose alpha-D-glucosyltransferase/alpha-amylase